MPFARFHKWFPQTVANLASLINSVSLLGLVGRGTRVHKLEKRGFLFWDHWPAFNREHMNHFCKFARNIYWFAILSWFFSFDLARENGIAEWRISLCSKPFYFSWKPFLEGGEFRSNVIFCFFVSTLQTKASQACTKNFLGWFFWFSPTI